MNYSTVRLRYPATIHLCGPAFYRQLHYHCLIVSGKVGNIGSGSRYAYTPADLRLLALRRLLALALSPALTAAKVNDAIHDAILDDRDPEHPAAVLVLEGAMIRLDIPLAVWAEIRPDRDHLDPDLDEAAEARTA